MDIILLLCSVAFCAGFIDSLVGGGGLIQTPLSLTLLPHLPVSTVIGTLKIPAFSGTSLAASQYLKKVKIQWRLFFTLSIIAFCSSFLGSELLTRVNNDFMKPVLLIILITLAIYTIFKKDFGNSTDKRLPYKQLIFRGCIVSFIVGFYDGFIGPATGTFFIVGFITLLGMDFLKANTHAKMINLATNLGSNFLFLLKGKILWSIALPMASFNALGGFLGAKLAIKKGNRFIRYLFIFIILLSISRFGFEVIFG